MNLFWINTVNLAGDQIIELYASELSLEELNNEQDDYFPYLGYLDQEDGEAMIKAGIDPSNEEACIKYAKEVKGLAIPETYTLICA